MKWIKHILIITAVLFFSASCMVEQVVVNKTRVDRVEGGETWDGYHAIYSLPRTVLNVQVVVEKKMVREGPFSQYAERYLGLTRVVSRNYDEYRIKEIRVTPYAEKDPDQLYKVTTEGQPVGARLTLTPEGIIAGVNLPWKPVDPLGPTSVVKLNHEDLYSPEYPDLSLRKHIEPMPDTTYWTVRTDTSFMQIPLLKTKLEEKTVPLQAEEAANVIFKLRKRRFYILNGEYAYRESVRTPMPEGEALEVILRELGQMEHDYVSLFAGREHTVEEVHSFTFTPNGQGFTEATILASFSTQRGLLPAIDTSGDPIRLQLTRLEENPLDQVEFQVNGTKNPVVPGFVFRVPEKVQVEVMTGGETLFIREMLVAQSGRVDVLPSELAVDSQTCIEYYPMYGSIKSIYTK